MISLAKNTLLSGGFSVVVVRNNEVLAAKNGGGVRPLLELYRQSPEVLLGSTLADKVIGKAAAVILALAGVREIYAQVLSEAAIPLLTSANIKYSYGSLVPSILNISGDGLCPLEQSVLPYDDKKEAYDALLARIEELMKQKLKKS